MSHPLARSLPAMDMFNACMKDAAGTGGKIPMRTLGGSGLEVSTIALGCFAFGGDKKTGVHSP